MTGTRRVHPIVHRLSATVEVPGSKSVSNRALVCAALASGESRIVHPAPGDDTVAMVAGLEALGLDVERAADRISVGGADGRIAARPATLDARLAGTTSRFLTALVALGRAPIVVDGAPPLRRRPMRPLHDALTALGAHVERPEATDLPARVTGPVRSVPLVLPGDVSSQYVSALMMIGPYLGEGLRIELSSELVSRPYVEMTAAVMSAFGVDAVEVAERSVVVPAGRYVGRTYEVEPDASSASYPLAVAAVVGGSVTVERLGAATLQGDAVFTDLLARMGCSVARDGRGVTVSRAPGRPLTGIEVDLADASDLVPTLAAVAAAATTPSRILGVGFIRGKESDRLGDLAGELRVLGADVDVLEDGLAIRPAPLHGGRIHTHHDHRVAMALAVLGCVVPGVEIVDPAVVSKSWPDFWERLDALAAQPASGA